MSDAIMNLVENSQESYENRSKCFGIFTDLTKTFDCVNHSLLLDKLQKYGIRGKSNDIVRAYLNNRTQHVYFNGKMSNSLNVIRGVPQGSILGPFLFLMYINDLPNHMNHLNKSLLTTMYADDTNFTFNLQKSDNIDETAVSEVIDHAQDWFSFNELVLNSNKTEICEFSLSPLNQNNSLTFLGVYIDSKLSWLTHIDYLCNRLSGVVFAVRRIRNIVNKEAALLTYFGLFHSVLTYGILGWGNTSLSQLQRIFVIQKAAVRSIVNAKRDEHCRPFFQELGIMTVFSTIVYENLIYVKNNSYKYFTHCDVHDYNTRGKCRLIPPRSRIEKSKVLGIPLYNSLPQQFKDLSLKPFKNKIKTLLKCYALYNIDEFYEMISSRTVTDPGRAGASWGGVQCLEMNREFD